MENLILACIQCQENFELTYDEQEKFEKRGFDLPLRCPQCRRHKSRDVERQEPWKPKNRKKRFRQRFDEFDE